MLGRENVDVLLSLHGFWGRLKGLLYLLLLSGNSIVPMSDLLAPS